MELLPVYNVHVACVCVRVCACVCVSVRVQGTAVFWYNLFATGEGDYSTRHAACPVLVGNKWGESDSRSSIQMESVSCIICRCPAPPAGCVQMQWFSPERVLRKLHYKLYRKTKVSIPIYG